MTKHSISERRYWAQRLGKTALRAIHILGIAGSGGGILLHVPFPQWQSYWVMAMCTGTIMMLWEIVKDWRWLIQLKGVLTLVKLLLLVLFIPLPDYQPELFVIILLLSVLVTHGPSGLRHYSVVHRRRLGGKKEVKG
ncbi:hypothetical protein NFHSH190041_07550 [Shewanella sp. NFH-SH190041]|uniref:hypothetical protein n=1 Tax=Shewanella sp. NFH-SH190041 TaxID=2950245 RepID=UPI0021C314FA|nr:hypothetical protein [Shewanella sp. NFH-SH190041]BDM63303.1 hypothetical protein NFHSH190041_07550 [Shewanella sp. NFH-SH190041]